MKLALLSLAAALTAYADSATDLLRSEVAGKGWLIFGARSSQGDWDLFMANCHSSGDWQFKQSVAVALPTVILKAGWLRCWAARFLPGCVAR